MTVQELVNAALRSINVFAAGEVPDYDSSTDALENLNRLIDKLAAERLAIYSTTRTTFTIVSGTRDYTVGLGGTVNVARPVYIDRVNYQITTTSPVLELPLQTLTDDGWEKIVLKTLTGIFPVSYYYNPTFPLGTLSLWMVPTRTDLQGVVYAPAAVAEVALADTLSLPPGYRDMLTTNLALRLAGEYGVPIPETLQQMASESMATAKRTNAHLSDLEVDPSLVVGHNRWGWSIYTGP